MFNVQAVGKEPHISHCRSMWRSGSYLQQSAADLNKAIMIDFATAVQAKHAVDKYRLAHTVHISVLLMRLSGPAQAFLQL